MMALVWIAMIVLIGIGIALLIRQQQAPAQEIPELSPGAAIAPTVFTLRTGDIVQHRDRDWVVEGQLTYNEGGFTWLEYMLQDGNDIRWLSVEEDDLVEVALSAPAREVEVENPPPKEIRVQGVTYRCVDSGEARMTRIGRTGIRRAEACRFYDYEGPDGQVLSVEDWDGDVEVTLGEEISPGSLRLLPGDGRRVYS